MRLPLTLLTLLTLAACASPSPDMTFAGASRHDITLNGIRFVVFHKDDEAQVIRMGYLTRDRRDAVPALMERAAAEATGCMAVAGSLTTRLPGDTGVGRVDLVC